MSLPKTRLVRSILALGLAVTLIAAVPASAESRRNPTVTFTYDPEASAATNYRNLVIRVRRACVQQGPRTITVMPNEQACIQGMTSLVVAEVNRPDLNAAYAAATDPSTAGRRQLAGR